MLQQQLQLAAGHRDPPLPGGGTLLVAYTNAKLLSNTDTLTSWLEGTDGRSWPGAGLEQSEGRKVALLAGYFAAAGDQLRA